RIGQADRSASARQLISQSGTACDGGVVVDRRVVVDDGAGVERRALVIRISGVERRGNRDINAARNDVGWDIEGDGHRGGVPARLEFLDVRVASSEFFSLRAAAVALRFS